MEEFRFHLDSETGQPHIYDHGVTEEEVKEAFWNRLTDFRQDRRTRIAVGQTDGGRYLRIIYNPDADGVGIFVVTAYDLRGKPKRALRRFMTEKPMKASKIPKRPRLPKGMTFDDIEAIRKYNESLTEDEEVAEMAAAFKDKENCLVFVPRRLLPKIRKILASAN